MARTSKRRLAATLVVTLGVADGIGIYVAHNKLDRQVDIGPRELAVANEPLAEPIELRANGDLKTAPALAASGVAPHAAPARAVSQTARLAVAEPVKAPAAVAPPAGQRASRQTDPVVTGRLADAEKPVSRRAQAGHAAVAARDFARSEDLRVHQQRIPARLTRAERRPFQEDAFAVAFGNSDEELRLPEPAYGGDPQPRGQASAELPPLELSAAQIHSEPAGTSDADALPAPPPTTAAGAEEVLPKS